MLSTSEARHQTPGCVAVLGGRWVPPGWGEQGACMDWRHSTLPSPSPVMCMHRALSFANKPWYQQALDPPAQCLFLRLHPRRGPWFRLGSLAYAEVADAAAAAQALANAGLAGLLERAGAASAQTLYPDPTPHEHACRPLAGPGRCACLSCRTLGSLLGMLLTWRETCTCCGPDNAQAAVAKE